MRHVGSLDMGAGAVPRQHFDDWATNNAAGEVLRSLRQLSREAREVPDYDRESQHALSALPEYPRFRERVEAFWDAFEVAHPLGTVSQDDYDEFQDTANQAGYGAAVVWSKNAKPGEDRKRFALPKVAMPSFGRKAPTMAARSAGDPVMKAPPTSFVHPVYPKPMSPGQRGDDVRTLQTTLKDKGLYTGPIDGIYGAGTVAAVKAFQAKNGGGLTVDGYAGAKTLAALYGGRHYPNVSGLQVGNFSVPSGALIGAGLGGLVGLVLAKHPADKFGYTLGAAIAGGALGHFAAGITPDTKKNLLTPAAAAPPSRYDAVRFATPGTNFRAPGSEWEEPWKAEGIDGPEWAAARSFMARLATNGVKAKGPYEDSWISADPNTRTNEVYDVARVVVEHTPEQATAVKMLARGDAKRAGLPETHLLITGTATGSKVVFAHPEARSDGMGEGVGEWSGHVGFLGLGKKEKAHAEIRRGYEQKEMARAERKAAQEQELDELERKVRLAELQKRAKDAGVVVPTPPQAAGLHRRRARPQTGADWT